MATIRTFIVEDSPVILDGLIGALEEFTPVQVVGTSDNEEAAVTWLAEHPQDCDLVIIDVFLRAGSGLGVLLAARSSQLPAHRVVLSNYANLDVRRRCFQLGADRVFDKSNEIEELFAYCAQLGGVVDSAGGVAGR